VEVKRLISVFVVRKTRLAPCHLLRGAAQIPLNASGEKDHENPRRRRL
jgi:hypothetical protein